MQIVSVEIDHNGAKLIKEMSPETYAELRERMVGILELPEASESLYDWSTYKFVGIMEDVEYLAGLGVKCQISRVRGTFVEKLPKLGVPEPIGQQVVNITIPNVGLLAIKKLLVLPDECTDAVQRYLDEGWRIVAVCPPNDTRRPTYILGHQEEMR